MNDATIRQELNRLISILGRVFGCLAISSCLAVAQPNLPSPQPDNSHWLDRLLKIPIPRFPTFVPFQNTASTNCSVAPLIPLLDPRAAIFVSGTGSLATIH